MVNTSIKLVIQSERLNSISDKLQDSKNLVGIQANITKENISQVFHNQASTSTHSANNQNNYSQWDH